jgi:hypothetical protein
MSECREIVGAIAQSGPVLISIHHDIEPPVQPVFDTSSRTTSFVEAFAG